jgi:hypothetical protein
MEKNIKLKANVFEREQYRENIDTTFSQLTSSVFIPTVTSSLSIPEFFDKYNTLFFDIPKKGNTSDEVLPSGSHELIARDFNPINNPTIQDLLQQINSIREEIASLNLQILEISNPEFIALNPDAADTGSASGAISTNPSTSNNQLQTPSSTTSTTQFTSTPPTGNLKRANIKL